MPGKKLLTKNEDFIKAWDSFIHNDKLQRNLIRDIIADSWLRSKSYGIDPLAKEIRVCLSKKEFNKRYKNNELLLNTAKPFMKSLYDIVGSTGFVVRLTDKDGYILGVGGDKTLVENNENLNMYQGCNVSEESIGTNAIGTALKTGKPIQVLGGEHYCKLYHGWTSSACPIKDDKGNVMGVLSMTGPYKKVHPHTHGMVHALADVIEKEMKLDTINLRLQKTNKHLNAIVESITEGLISINNKGMIRGINEFGCKILGLKESEILGKNVNSFIDNKNTKKIIDVIKEGVKFEEEEVNIKTKRGKKILCIGNATSIKSDNPSKSDGLIFVFREAKVVHNLVNKIVGAEARFTFEDILGESKEIKDMIKLATQSAKTDATILLLGESGTGKEMFAQAIHNESKRKKNPFVFLNCGAIPRELVASELFGYVEGAFTGAKRGGHPGKFELADGGTIFLDEIGDMPLDTQANLLRVLENKEVVRVGGHDVIPVNVRVIAATHKNLKEEVELGNFRRDLFYRLNVMPIHTPSLRERKNDIKIFIDYFVDKFSEKMNKKIKGISKEFYERMLAYTWPGNVRELQNVIQLVINTLDSEEILSEKYLPKHMRENDLKVEDEINDELISLEEIEKRAIVNTLRAVKGNIAKGSKILGIGRSTLYRKMEKYNIKVIHNDTYVL